MREFELPEGSALTTLILAARDAGEHITLTSGGQPIAHLRPVQRQLSQEEREALFADLFALRDALIEPPEPFDWKKAARGWPD